MGFGNLQEKLEKSHNVIFLTNSCNFKEAKYRYDKQKRRCQKCDFSLRLAVYQALKHFFKYVIGKEHENQPIRNKIWENVVKIPIFHNALLMKTF